MTIVTTKVQAGRVELAVPGDWPNGLEVEIRPLAVPSSNDDDLMTPDEIANTLAAMRAMKPMDENSEVHKKTEELISERKNREKADYLHHLERLKKGWH